MLLREEALVAKDNRIIHLEDMDVKNRILERYDGITPQTIANSLTEDQFYKTNVRRCINDESDERNARKYWHDTTQQNQGRINEYRRNNRRWTVRYNNDTERWRRMSNGCIRQAQHLKGQFRASQIHINNLQQIFVLQNPNMATIQDITITLAPHLAAM
ncbi:hypothetical protein RhiirB3_430495 [Rhizophagus irregularis]|nr:hypothetical protein RhiirB3_430495 [Rhizophagus irregularis]